MNVNIDDLKLPKTCACGEPMHLSYGQKILMKTMHERWGDYKIVKILNGKTYKVPTYYIVLHGLKADDLRHLGFEEITN